MERKGRQNNHRLKIVETPDAFVLFQREADLDDFQLEADLDDDVDFLKPYFYPLFLNLSGLLEGSLVAVQHSGGARFKYLSVPKRRNRFLQKVMLNSFIGGLPYLLAARDFETALLDLNERTIFNGFPIPCVSESDEEYFLAIALPADIGELVKPRKLAGKTLLPGPKILFPSLHLSQVEGAANIVKSTKDAKKIGLYFGGLHEYYARFPTILAEDYASVVESFAGNDFGKQPALAQNGEDLALLKQAAFLQFVDRAFTRQIFLDACGIYAAWCWTDKSRDFSKDFDEAAAVDSFPFYFHSEKISDVCRCSPHLPVLAQLLNRKGVDYGAHLGYFYFSPRLDQLRLSVIVFCALLDTTSGEVRLELLWPSFGLSNIDFLNVPELERLYELELALLERERDKAMQLRDEGLKLALGSLKFMSYMGGKVKVIYAPKSLYTEREEDFTDLAGIHESFSFAEYWIDTALPKFCPRCGLFLAFTDETLLSAIRDEESTHEDEESTHDTNQESDRVN